MHGEALRDQIFRTVVPQGAIAVWSLGQAGVVIKGAIGDAKGGADASMSDAIVVIDPYLTHAIEFNNPGTAFIRECDPPLEPEQLAGVTAVLITHHHDDHLDVETIRRLQRVSPETVFVAPKPHVDMLRGAGVSAKGVIGVDEGAALTIHGVRVCPIAAAHEAYEFDEHGHHKYLGYLVSMGDVTVYHSGDTVVTQKLVDDLRGVRPHIAMLPINGRDYKRAAEGIVGNMNMREAVDLAVEIEADMLWPNHYDLFPNNRENPAHLVDYIFHHHRNLKFHMCALGERFIYFG